MDENPYRRIESGEPGRIGWRIDYFAELDSTQERARQMAANGAPQGTVVIAEHQSAGRGRMRRRWHSPDAANLYTTIILRPKLPLAEIPQLSLVAGVAVAEALETVAPGLVGLKWPNDIWLKGRKAGGILAEAVTDSSQRLSCVLLGIGINVNLSAGEFPEDLRDRAISVRAATGKRCDRVALAAELFSRLDSRYMEMEAHGFASIRLAWERYSVLTGRRVVVLEGTTRRAGIVKGIDSDGALLLETEGAVSRVIAGDASIEGAYD